MAGIVEVVGEGASIVLRTVSEMTLGMSEQTRGRVRFLDEASWLGYSTPCGTAWSADRN